MQRSRLVPSDHPILGSSADPELARALVAVAGHDEVLAYTAREMLTFLDEHPDALDRGCTDGHLTCSSLLVDHEASRTLVLFHTKLRKWLQPGGHADGEANLAAVALREAEEETGISGLQILPRPIDLDIHEVRPQWEEPHLHLDVRFLVVSPPGARELGNHESIELRWTREYELIELGADRSLQRLARSGFEQAKTLLDLLEVEQPSPVVTRALETAKGVVAGRRHPYSGAMAIWSDVREHDGEGFEELRSFISLAGAWQLNAELREVLETAIVEAAEHLLETSGT